MNTEQQFKDNLTQNKFTPISQLGELSDEDRHVSNHRITEAHLLRPAEELVWLDTALPIHFEEPQHPKPDPKHPFTPAEEEIQQYLLKMQLLFVSLPNQNKNAANDFLFHTRALRRILATRIIAREFNQYETES